MIIRFSVVFISLVLLCADASAHPLIARAAGLSQPDLLTHTGGGITGSARYKWEQENGIFQFDGRPVPKLK